MAATWWQQWKARWFPARRRPRPRYRPHLEALEARFLPSFLGTSTFGTHSGPRAVVLAEGVSVAYAFDWTLDTVTTLGSIQDPHNTAGRVVKVCLELLGIGTLFYGLATVAEFFVSGQLSGVLE